MTRWPEHSSTYAALVLAFLAIAALIHWAD